MLLANMTVAKFIGGAYPARALLRCHPDPNERKLAELEQFAAEQGLPIDATSSFTLHESLQALSLTNPDGYEVAKLLATMPMQLARYFCTGVQDEAGGRLRNNRSTDVDSTLISSFSSSARLHEHWP